MHDLVGDVQLMVDDLHGVNKDSQSTTIIIHEHVYGVWVTLVLLVNRNCQTNTCTYMYIQPVHEHVEILRMQHIYITRIKPEVMVICVFFIHMGTSENSNYC